MRSIGWAGPSRRSCTPRWRTSLSISRSAKGPPPRPIRLPLPRFTVVGATPRLALLTAPLRARFGAVHRLDFYEPQAMELIVERAGSMLEIGIDAQGLGEIACRARGTPRVALRLLLRVRNFAEVRADGRITRPRAP